MVLVQNASLIEASTLVKVGSNNVINMCRNMHHILIGNWQQPTEHESLIINDAIISSPKSVSQVLSGEASNTNPNCSF